MPFLRTICLFALLGSFSLPAGRAQTGLRNEISVKEHGAVGDGTTDDTLAFEQTLQAAKTAGLPVRIPRGTYSLSRTINVDNQEIIGATSGAWPSDGDALPSVVDRAADGPCFQLLAGGSLHGLNIDYGRPRDDHFKYAAVLVTGGGVYLSNLRIRGAYDGIAADGVHNVGRLNVENVFMAGVQHEGMRVTGTWDVPRLSNVEVWNNEVAPVPYKTGVGFHLGRNDGLRMTDCFVFAMNVGYLFEETGQTAQAQGLTKGSLNGCSADFCSTGVRVNGAHWLSMSGGFFWCHQSALVVDGPAAKVQLTGSLLKSNGAPCVQVLAAGAVVITGCDLTRPMPEHPGPGVRLAGGTTVLGTNYIDAYGDGVQAAKGVESANISGNTIVARGGQGIAIDPDAKAAAANNVVVIK